MRRVLLVLLFALPAAQTHALGTPAGEDIVNTVQVNYTIGGSPRPPLFDSVTFFVDELIDVDVTLQSAGPVLTTAGATSQVLTYLLTNIGNGVESFTLAETTLLVGDDFDPIPAGIYLDGNGNGVLDGADPLYAPGVNDPLLDANTPGAASVLVFLLNDIPPGPPLVNGDLGDAQLTAVANAHAGPPGSFTAGAGDGGTDAVAGASAGSDAMLGSYEVTDTLVQVAKSAAVNDGFGGSNPAPGAVITYTLDVRVTGSQTALGVVITDPIPTNTAYQLATITLNGAPLTDVGGDDFGDYNVSNPGEITVALGDLDSTSPTQTITFQVRIN